MAKAKKAIAAKPASVPVADEAPEQVDAVAGPDLSTVLEEMGRLRRRDAEREAELEAIKEGLAAGKAADPESQGPVPGPWDQPEIGAVVESTKGAGMRDEAALAAFDEMYDVDKGGVYVKMKSCGASVLIEFPEMFPRYDMRCPCGRAHHKIIKYQMVEGK